METYHIGTCSRATLAHAIRRLHKTRLIADQHFWIVIRYGIKSYLNHPNLVPKPNEILNRKINVS